MAESRSVTRSAASKASVDQVPSPYWAASTAGAKGVDRALHEVARAGPTHAAGAGKNVTGLHERDRAYERTGEAIGRGDPRSDSAGSRADAGSDSWFIGTARRGASFGSDDCCRAGQHHLPLRARTGSDGV